MIDTLNEILQSDWILSNLQRLEDVYAELDEDQNKWIEVSPFRCPSGCGRCCERFVPDVWEIEALYIAARLIIEGRDSTVLERFRENDRGEDDRELYMNQVDNEGTPGGQRPTGNSACPLYQAEGEFHCTVYKTRPLVCRAFGFAGDRDKWGQLRFSPCRFMEIKTEGQKASDAATHLRMWKRDKLLECFPFLPPDMTLYARRVQTIEPSWAGDRDLLDTMLPKAIKKLRFYTRFASPDRAA